MTVDWHVRKSLARATELRNFACEITAYIPENYGLCPGRTKPAQQRPSSDGHFLARRLVDCIGIAGATRDGTCRLAPGRRADLRRHDVVKLAHAVEDLLGRLLACSRPGPRPSRTRAARRTGSSPSGIAASSRDVLGAVDRDRHDRHARLEREAAEPGLRLAELLAARAAALAVHADDAPAPRIVWAVMNASSSCFPRETGNMPPWFMMKSIGGWNSCDFAMNCTSRRRNIARKKWSRFEKWFGARIAGPLRGDVLARRSPAPGRAATGRRQHHADDPVHPVRAPRRARAVVLVEELGGAGVDVDLRLHGQSALPQHASAVTGLDSGSARDDSSSISFAQPREPLQRPPPARDQRLPLVLALICGSKRPASRHIEPTCSSVQAPVATPAR